MFGVPKPELDAKYFALREAIRSKLVEKLDLTKVADLSPDILRRELRLVVTRLVEIEKVQLDSVTFDFLATQVSDEVLSGRPMQGG